MSELLAGKLAARNARAIEVNKLLSVIAQCGRRFFFHKGVVSSVEVDARGLVWFVDSYTKKRIYTHRSGKWRGFSNGGTLRRLTENLRDYIMHGTPQRLNLGPWPQEYCGGDLWGYGDEMNKVRDAAFRLGIAR